MKRFIEIVVYQLVVIYFYDVSSQAGDYAARVCRHPKLGSCPSTLINPSSVACKYNSDCHGSRKCCEFKYPTKYCSDVENSKNYLRCPADFNYNLVTGSSVIKNRLQCYSDNNCGRSNNLKCCFNPEDCNSYCLEGERNCFSLLNKPLDKCPKEVVNAELTCESNDECPGNQVCCAWKNNENRCSAPFYEKSGTCPNANKLRIIDSVSCFSDSDCPATEKCCPFNNCTYICSKPL